MLLPLIGRAIESEKQDPILYDSAALKVLENIDYDWQRLRANISEYSSISWAARARQFAKIVELYLQEHPDATVVNLGAGLDTTFEAVDNGRLRWVNLDFPAVNDLRRQLLPECERVFVIDGDVLDPLVLGNIDANESGMFFLASGLLIYFDETDIRKLLTTIADLFQTCAIAFDRLSTNSLKYVQKSLTTGGLLEARIIWGLDDTRVIIGGFPHRPSRRTRW